MLHKSFEALDTKVDAEAGTFEATVAIFNNVDKGGDRIIPGAFKKTLAAWKASGDPIPVIFNHDWASPDAHVGVVEDAKETTLGLWVKGRLDVADNPVAKQVHRLMSRRSLKEFSFGYSVPAGGERRAKDGANDLLEIVLAEVGPTLKGMNPATELHAVKSALGVDKPADPVEQDRKARDVAREVEGHRVEDAAPAVTPSSKSAGAYVYDAQGEIAAIKAELDETKRKLEEVSKRPEKTPEQLAAESKRVAKEVEEHRLPPKGKRLANDLREQIDVAGGERFGRGEDRWSYLDDYDPDGNWAVFSVSNQNDRRYVQVDYVTNADGTVTLGATETEVVRTTTYRAADGKAYGNTELQETQSQLAETREELETLKSSKAEEAAKETKSRVADPLRQQAEATALAVASGGLRLPPPQTPAPPTAPTLELGELKRRMRDEMLGVLSGGIEA